MLTAAVTRDIRRHLGWNSSVEEQAHRRSATMRALAFGRRELPSCLAHRANCHDRRHERLTGRSCACSEEGPLRPLTCSGLGVAVPPPCSEFSELFTLLPGVDDC